MTIMAFKQLIPLYLIILVIIPYMIINTFLTKDITKNGEKPVYILWTKWRSGSTTIGELLAEGKPNTFYSYEPLHPWGVKIFYKRNNTEAIRAVNHVIQSSNCNLSENETIFENYFTTKSIIRINPLTKLICKTEDCRDPSFMEDWCHSSDRHIMKILRLSLAFAEDILKMQLNVKILYMIRDPRAVISSRRTKNWCNVEACYNPSDVCLHLIYDYEYAGVLSRKYRKRFMVIRFEDINTNPLKEFDKIWNFFGEEFSIVERNRVSSAFLMQNNPKNENSIIKKRLKISSSRGFSWLNNYIIKDFLNVQNDCLLPLKHFGYKLLYSEEELKNDSISTFHEDFTL